MTNKSSLSPQISLFSNKQHEVYRSTNTITPQIIITLKNDGVCGSTIFMFMGCETVLQNSIFISRRCLKWIAVFCLVWKIGRFIGFYAGVTFVFRSIWNFCVLHFLSSSTHESGCFGKKCGTAPNIVLPFCSYTEILQYSTILRTKVRGFWQKLPYININNRIFQIWASIC